MDKTLVINLMILFCVVNAEDSRTFPSSFSFGTGTSAYQTEGAWNQDGKSENIWDHWIHSDPSRIKNNDTADVACDTYNSPSLDVYFLTRIGVQHYIFSIPWSRILPNGIADEINMKAIINYQSLINYMQYFNITPIVTMYYHDLPQSLQDIGGWTNPAMAKYFEDYARVLFQYFPNVEYWITFNDPRSICRKGYGEGTFAPGIKSDGVGEYLCAYTVLKAHAAAYRLYKEEFKDLKGKISISLDMIWSEPTTTDDKVATERRNAFEFGLYANPIYNGDWPREVKYRVDYRSKNENFTKSRLPKLTDEEINYINGTADFMAVSLFYTNLVEDAYEAEFGDPSYTKDMKAKVYLNSSWDLAVNGQPIVPWSAKEALSWLSWTYNDPEIFITANGIPDSNSIRDSTRVNYFRDYLNAILDAMNDDRVKVIGYTAWSLYDCFEWTDGYSYKFGMYWTDFESGPTFRLDKNSLKFYQQVIETFTVPAETITTITTDLTTDLTTDDTASTTTTNVPETTPGAASKIVLCPALILIIVCLLKL